MEGYNLSALLEEEPHFRRFVPRIDAILAEPTKGAQEIFQQAFADPLVHELFDIASPSPGVLLPFERQKFIEYICSTYQLSIYEADDIFFRLSMRRANGEA